MNTELTPFQTFIPLLTPIVIAALKYLWPRVPKVWLPFLAPVLGALAEIAGQAAGLSGGSVLTASLMGALGVWLREAYDQARKQSLHPPAPEPPANT